MFFKKEEEQILVYYTIEDLKWNNNIYVTNVNFTVIISHNGINTMKQVNIKLVKENLDQIKKIGNV